MDFIPRSSNANTVFDFQLFGVKHARASRSLFIARWSARGGLVTVTVVFELDLCQIYVKRPYTTRRVLGFYRQVIAYCCMKAVQLYLHYFHSAISNHLSIAISMSPEWVVAYNRFNCR